METSSQTMGQFWKTCCIQCQKLVIAYHFMYCAAKLPKPLCQAPLYTITRLFQAWLPSRRPLQFSTKRRRQWPSQRTSSFTNEGNKYLKFRPTAQPIISLLLGHGPKRNASCSQHEPLTQPIEARNAGIKKFQTETPEDEPSQNLFDQENDEPPAKKKRCTVSAPFVVTITACDKAVDCLVSSQRPTRSDLAILMEPSHLEPVLCHLRPGIATALQMPTKAHKATK